MTPDPEILEGEVVTEAPPRPHAKSAKTATAVVAPRGCGPGCLIFLAGFVVALVLQNFLIFAIGVVLTLLFIFRPPRAE